MFHGNLRPGIRGILNHQLSGHSVRKGGDGPPWDLPWICDLFFGINRLRRAQKPSYQGGEITPVAGVKPPQLPPLMFGETNTGEKTPWYNYGFVD